MAAHRSAARNDTPGSATSTNATAEALSRLPPPQAEEHGKITHNPPPPFYVKILDGNSALRQ
jgi:hypothetical protein